MLTVAIPKRNKLQNIIVLTPKDGLHSITKGKLQHGLENGRLKKFDKNE